MCGVRCVCVCSLTQSTKPRSSSPSSPTSLSSPSSYQTTLQAQGMDRLRHRLKAIRELGGVGDLPPVGRAVCRHPAVVRVDELVAGGLKPRRVNLLGGGDEDGGVHTAAVQVPRVEAHGRRARDVPRRGARKEGSQQGNHGDGEMMSRHHGWIGRGGNGAH